MFLVAQACLCKSKQTLWMIITCFLLSIFHTVFVGAKCYMMQEMDDVERKLSELQREQFHSKELELKAAQDRHLAIEDLEKAV